MYIGKLLIIWMIAFLAGCSPKAEVVEVKETLSKDAYANCVKEKEGEVDNSTEASKRYSWKPEEIKEYCEENWRAYRD